MAEQLDLLTSSAAGSPVRTSAPQEKAPASTEHVPGCGSRCTESCAKCGPLGSLLKTSLLCELEALTGCSLTWKRASTPLGRSWWVLTTSASRIEESEHGSSAEEWPTPTATPYGSSNNGCPGDGRAEYATKGKPSLDAMALWPTATAGDAKASGSRTTASSNAHPGISLTDAAVHGISIRDTADRKAWATPTARDWKDTPGQASCNDEHDYCDLLPRQVFADQQHPESSSTNGKPLEPSRLLNADWVFQLMGYPREWGRLSTARGSKQRATQSSRTSPRSSAEQFCE